jgi:hypothetical protein
MSRQITSRTTLDHLKAEAKRWLKALRANDADARARFERSIADAPVAPALRDVQHAVAREYGLAGWDAARKRLSPDSPMRRYDAVADALVVVYRSPDEPAMRIVWHYFGHMRAWDALRRYVRLDLGRTEEPLSAADDEVTLEDARFLVARAQEFDSWNALEAYMATVPPGRTLASKAIALVSAERSRSGEVVGRSRDWDEVIEQVRSRRLEGIGAMGQMTDAMLERVSRIEHLEMLDLHSCRALSDAGLQLLARLPRLRWLNLGGCPGVSDRGLQVLEHLPALETINLGWTPITDQGARHLAACPRLRDVDLSATATGDETIRALAGKEALANFRSGDGVTDAGLALLHGLPVFKTWRDGDARMALLGFDAGPNFLMLRGTFSDAGFAQLAGLDGLFALSVDSDRLAITGKALAPLVDLPHLEWLAFAAKDDSMPYIAALPRLRFLMCQDTTAGDEGFVALSRSRTIEHIWGRRCYNLQRRGFTALADMPALAHLSVSCKNVDDTGLSALPRFPALRELMPMDVPDDGYRHVGQCHGLTSLVLMYCRDTGDVATSHITGLPNLAKYFASYNRITDRTPELLAGMTPLEEITFDSCAALTNAGIAALARLPRLRQLTVSGMPHVTADVVTAFGPGVNVRQSR